jgi:hypothetical protein
LTGPEYLQAIATSFATSAVVFAIIGLLVVVHADDDDDSSDLSSSIALAAHWVGGIIVGSSQLIPAFVEMGPKQAYIGIGMTVVGSLLCFYGFYAGRNGKRPGKYMGPYAPEANAKTDPEAYVDTCSKSVFHEE